MVHGTVKWFNDAKGVGIIECEDHTEVFVHWSRIAVDGFKLLDDGQPVELRVVNGPRGLEASTVVPAFA